MTLNGVIDQIVQSKLIISSSLHGIILADVYNVLLCGIVVWVKT